MGGSVPYPQALPCRNVYTEDKYVFPKIDVLFAGGTNVLGKVNLPREYLSFLQEMV